MGSGQRPCWLFPSSSSPWGISATRWRSGRSNGANRSTGFTSSWQRLRWSNDEAARLIKSAVIATEKRAKLWGLEAPSQLQVQSQNLNVSVEVTGTPEEVAGKIEKTHGLPAGAVQNIGRQLAQARSVALLEAETEAIDVGD